VDEKLEELRAEFAVARAESKRFALIVGRLIFAWRDVEHHLFRVLVRYSGVSEAVGRAIFSGTRARTMIDNIRSIAYNTGMDSVRNADLSRTFAQLLVINAMRDHIVHHASEYGYVFDDPMKRIIVNERTSKLGKAIAFEIGSDEIHSMVSDLGLISNHLMIHWNAQFQDEPFRPWNVIHGLDAPPPWSYKPPQPIGSWERPPEGAQ
jgi:hypothetical protein